VKAPALDVAKERRIVGQRVGLGQRDRLEGRGVELDLADVYRALKLSETAFVEAAAPARRVTAVVRTTSPSSARWSSLTG